MNKFVIVDGLPYLYAGGKAYAVRWDENGFTVGAEVELASVPAVTYSELSIKAKCHSCLNSIDVPEPQQDGQEDQQAEQQPEQQEEGGQDDSQQEDEPQQDGQEDQQAEPLEKMTVAQLKAYAAEKGIDLNGATKKADIIEAIKAAE